MNDNASWAGVVKAFLTAKSINEADEHRKILADLFEDAGDEFADELRTPSIKLWLLEDDDELFGSFDAMNKTPQQYLDDNLHEFHTPLEALRFEYGVLECNNATFSEYSPVLYRDEAEALRKATAAYDEAYDLFVDEEPWEEVDDFDDDTADADWEPEDHVP